MTSNTGIQLLSVLSIFIPFLLMALASNWYSKKHEALAGWWVSKGIAIVGKILSLIVTLAVIGIYQGGAWDFVKAVFKIKV